MNTDSIVKRWQDLGNLVLGAWLFVSPWIMQYPAEIPAATWNAYISGAVIVVFAAIAMYMPKIWEEGLNMALGIWMIVSPWILGFSTYRDVTINAVVVGVAVAALAAWAMLRDKDFIKWQHDRHAAP